MGLEMYKREWLKNCAIIKQPGIKVSVRVAATVTEGNRVKTESGEKYIVQLKAIPMDKLENLEKLFKGKTEVPMKEMSRFLLSANLWVNNPAHPPQLPMRDEEVYVNIAWVNNKQKTAKVLRATDIQLKPPRKAEEGDWQSFFAKVDSPPVNEKTGQVETKTAAVEDNDDITH